LTTYNKVLGKKGNIISIFMTEWRLQAFLEMLLIVIFTAVNLARMGMTA
jgi:hypothetical protein